MPRSRVLPVRSACCWSPVWSICWCGRWRASPGRCRCCRTPCTRRGNGARVARSPSRAIKRPAGSEARSPSPPRRCTTGSPPNNGHCCAICSCAWSRRPRTANRCAAASPAAPSPPTPNTNGSSNCWSRARLVTSDDETVELAHESLARAWPRLRTWLDDDVEGQRILRHLALTADAWDTMDRPDSELYRGVRLAQALEWQRRANPDLTPAERAFLEASAERERSEAATTEQRLRQQTRQNRQLRGLLAGAAVLLVVAMVAGLLAVRQADRADRADRRCRRPPCWRAGAARRRHRSLVAARRRRYAARRFDRHENEPPRRAVEDPGADPFAARRWNRTHVRRVEPGWPGRRPSPPSPVVCRSTTRAPGDSSTPTTSYRSTSSGSGPTADSSRSRRMPASKRNTAPRAIRAAPGHRHMDRGASPARRHPRGCVGLPAALQRRWPVPRGSFRQTIRDGAQRLSSSGIWRHGTSPCCSCELAGIGHAVALSPDGSRLYVGSSYRSPPVMSVYDVATGRSLDSVTTAGQHGGWTSVPTVRCSPQPATT